MLRWISIAVSITVLAPSSGRADEATRAGCTVRLASVDAASVPTFRGECRWPVGAAFVTAVLTDPVRFAASSSSLEESRRLPDGRIVNVQTAGWPLADRQSTLVMSDELLPGGGLRRTYQLASSQEPPAGGRVQVSVDEGSWEVSAAPDGGTRVLLVMRYEPGGNLPPSLVQRASPGRIAVALAELRAAAETLARAGSANADVAAGPGGR